MMAKKKSLEFLSGGGEMGERIRNFDWDNNPLGPPEHWDASLKTCVRIMLNSQQPIWIGWGPHAIKLYNDAYIDIVRGKHPNALGQPAEVVWKEIWNEVGPRFRDALKSGQGNYWESDLLIMERSGFPEEVYYTYSYTPVLDEQGQNAGILCYNTSDTERILNQRSLETLSRLSSTLTTSASQDEVYRKAVHALSLNDKDFPVIVLYQVDEAKGVAVAKAMTGIDASPGEMKRLLTIGFQDDGELNNFTRAIFENTMVYFTNDGHWKNIATGAWDKPPHHFVHVPIKSPNNKLPVAVMTIGLNPYRKFDEGFQDFIQLIADQVSQGIHNAIAYEEERRRIDAMEELDKAKTRFFANISHEFRTPITLLLGNIEEIINDKNAGPHVHARMEVANRNALRLLKLVNSLLDFSRIESGRQQANYVLTDIAAFTSNLAGYFHSVMEKAGLKLIINADAVIKPVYLDRSMWEKVVFNLLSNAFKYTLSGKVTVSLSAKDSHAVLTVSDTGVGIPEHELPYMFDRFHRVENTAGRTFEGTGIGLSLVKELVHLHGGTITVESVEGKGSSFTVRIPFGKEHLPQAKVTDKADEFINVTADAYIDEAVSYLDKPIRELDPLPTGDDVESVLIVDDNADMRQHLQSLLQPAFPTIMAANGLDALHKVQEHHPGLILSDIMMPMMDGFQLVAEIKKNPQTQHIPVILLTARAGQESRLDGYDHGADDYLVKPFSSRELLARIKAQFRLKRRQQEAMHSIRNSELELQRIISQAPFIVMAVEGSDFVIKVANERAQEFLQRSKEQLLGKPAFEVIPEAVRSGYRDFLIEVMTTGKSFVGREIPTEINRNGSMVNTYLDFVFEPMRDASQTITGVMGLGIDVTDRVLGRKQEIAGF